MRWDDDDDGPRSSLERAAFTASRAQVAHDLAVYDELSTIHRELVTEAARLAARIEERLSPRRSE